MKFSIDTLGCKVNHSESDFITRELLKRGLEPVSWRDHPDFCIINTCTVTSQSDKKTRQLIRRIRTRNKSSRVIVTGCFVVYNREFLESQGVDRVISNKDKSRIAELIVKEAKIKKDLDDIKPVSSILSDYLHSRPMIKIQDGCQQKCSYCIVPKVRGKYKSIPFHKILRDIKNFHRDGFEEVVLTGVNMGKYGIDLGNSISDKGGKVSSFAELLGKIAAGTEVKRIRISSIEVNDIDSSLIGVLKNNSDRFVHHLHIPLQSGSNRVLGLMRRPYNAQYYIKRIKAIQHIFPDITFTTDVMVGFPGEDDRDFMQTVEMVKEVNFSKVHVFKFSKRTGTEACLLGGQVSEEVKFERSKILRDIGSCLRDAHIKGNIGKSLDVVCEKVSDKINIIRGTSENYIKVYFSKEKKDFSSLRGRIVKIITTSKCRNGLWGILSQVY
jgi:threonylcarbamoyladenosine tRNA methylthiotransferase MtaB